MDTFDIAEAVLSAKSEEIKSDFLVNYDKLDILREYCEAIDIFVENHDGDSVAVSVTDDMKVSISINIEDFVYESRFKPPVYLDLMERADSIKFTNLGDERLGVEFIFPSIWESKKEK